MTIIIGPDLSHWQGKLDDEAIEKMLAMGVKFAGVKWSQGINYADDCAEENTDKLQDAGILVWPYHFVTTANALEQFNWFVACVKDRQFNLPPAMDVEYYSSNSSKAIRAANYQGNQETEAEVIKEFRYDTPRYNAQLAAILRGYTIPSAAIVDSIGMKLTAWMTGQTEIKINAEFPTIYTNVSSGNAVFTSKYLSMNRYNLWVANWKVATPNLPAIWKGKPWLVWQDGVVDGRPYGIDGQMDHNIWGELFPFPGYTPPPPPDPEPDNTIIATIEFPDGRVFSGTLEAE